jgi:hypothetical protein
MHILDPYLNICNYLVSVLHTVWFRSLQRGGNQIRHFQVSIVEMVKADETK